MFVYSVGILIKPIAEVQRTLFKDKPKNKGKPYARVLFLLARNINYVGYILWRLSVTLVCGGPVMGALIAAFFTWNFTT
jgi:steroid 5-alpha reductase family enzyme